MKDRDLVILKVTEKNIKEGIPASNTRCALAECVRDNVDFFIPSVTCSEIVLLQSGRVRFKLYPLDESNHYNFVTTFDRTAERTPPVTLLYRAIKVADGINY